MLQQSFLINSFEEHNYIANFDYYHDIKEFTPETYFNFEDIPQEGPFVVKGKTNSRKFEWNKRMYAETKEQAINIGLDLMTDGLIGNQGVLVRKYVPLKTYQIGLNGLPFTNEWRFFYYQDNLLSHGYYWTISDKKGEMDISGVIFADKIAEIISKKTTFFVLDIAQTEAGDWILIEVNDAQMSGLSGNSADTLYGNLSKILFKLN